MKTKGTSKLTEWSRNRTRNWNKILGDAAILQALYGNDMTPSGGRDGIGIVPPNQDNSENRIADTRSIFLKIHRELIVYYSTQGAWGAYDINDDTYAQKRKEKPVAWIHRAITVI